MQETIFYQLGIVMAVAAVVSLIVRAFRQPLIIGYIITGFIVGPTLLGVIHNHEAFESFSQIGITLLLFIVGLGLNVGIVKDTGKPVFVTFSAITAIVGGLGYAASHFLGFDPKESLVMACGLLFSSTIIVVKALSDKKEQSRLYGQIAIGILLVEDIAATLALLFLSSSSSDTSSSNDIALLLAKGVLLASALTFIGRYILPRLSNLFAASQELLYIFALAWAFGVACMFWWAGFSIEVGALFAGVTMAGLPYVQAIGNRLKPLRDFFLVLFFIKLGEGLGLDNISAALVPALIFSTIIMISKPLVILASLGLLGYTKQTSFKAAVHLSQISEFSIIFIVLAVKQGFGTDELVAITTLTALITIAVSAYLMKYDDALYRRLSNILTVFERSNTKKDLKSISTYPLVLVGYSDGGFSFLDTFKKMHKQYIVIDYDPDVIESLERRHIKHLYGDATDIEFLDELGLHKSEIIVSTVENTSTNVLLATHISAVNPDGVFICRAATFENAEELYDAGASYVMLPQLIGDTHINQFLIKHGSNKKAFSAYRKKHLQALGNTLLQRM
jgi:Kef-type K+ transport system membrane component KefB